MVDIEEFMIEIMGLEPDMYNGNKPTTKGHKRVSGEYNDKWCTKYGDGETFKDKIDFFSFNLNHKINIYICGDTLWITDIRYSGKSDVYDYCNNGKLQSNNRTRHELEPEKIGKYLNTEIPNCKIWDMIQKRAWELIKIDIKENRNNVKSK